MGLAPRSTLARAHPCYLRRTAEEVTRMDRPPFIVSTAAVPETDHTYPDSEERLAVGRA